MSLIIQHGLELPNQSYKVVYDDKSGTGEELVMGAVLCMDSLAVATPAAGDFDEQQVGRIYTKPLTGNLTMPKGVVVTPPQRLRHGSLTDYSSVDVEVVDPKESRFFWVLVDALDYAVGDVLEAVDDEFYLTREAAGSGAQPITTHSVAIVVKADARSGESGATLMKVAGL